MTDKDLIVVQAKHIEQLSAENTELRNKLAEAETVRNYWFNEAQHSILVHCPSSVEEHNLIVDLLKRGTVL